MEKQFGLLYDQDGAKARTGNIDTALLAELNALPYYKKTAPKSLGTEWLTSHFTPLIQHSTLRPEDALCTISEHIAFQIAAVLNSFKATRVLITGGGAKNHFLVERIRAHFNGEVILPEDELIEFKESIIFGFLGALYLAKQTNTRSAVTGATRDSTGGVFHLP